MKIIKQLKSDWIKYGFETIAVIVGILAAFALDSWNDERQLEKTERNLLMEMQSNLQTNIVNLEHDIAIQIRGLWCIDYIIDHFENKRPFHDSIPYLLSEAEYIPDVVLTSSAFETLKSYGLELIKSDSLRREVIYLFEVVYPTLMQETRRLEDQLWPAVVTPMYQKHFRRTKDRAIPNNYDMLLEDEEFLNMLSFRGVLREQSTTKKRVVSQQTADLIRLIENSVEHRY